MDTSRHRLQGESMTAVGILLATQRTGTHLLKSAIDSHPRVAAPFREAFFPDNLEFDDNFFGYLLNLVKSDASWALPQRRVELFERYLSDLPDICGKPHVLIDLKYNSIHHIHSDWHHPGDRPTLFEIVRRDG